MPKRTDINRILVIGSGPIIIGQAAEFDYAGTQACQSLKEEGYEVILVNSNPATIMTDTEVADKVYMEPLTKEFLSKIIRKERPDAVLPSLGGQTGLNLVVELAEDGILRECNVEILGTDLSAIKKANRRKHQPLNESIPLTVERVDSEWGETNTEEAGFVKGTMESNPEAVALLREIAEVLQAQNSGLFSNFERQVWAERLKGYAYTEIAAHLGKSPKSIDNAMQRIRKKVLTYMEK